MTSAEPPEQVCVVGNIKVDFPDSTSAAEKLEILVYQTDVEEAIGIAVLSFVSDISARADSVLVVPHAVTSLLHLQIRVQGSDESLYASQVSLQEFGVGVTGFTGSIDKASLAASKVAEPPPPEPKGKKGSAPPVVEVPAAMLSAFWRVQRALPPMRDHRCPPLGLKYVATESRKQQYARTKAWEQQMRELNEGTGTSAPTPKHFLGDSSSRQLLANYTQSKCQTQAALTSHSLTMEVIRMQECCMTCHTAEEASQALIAVKQFILLGSHLTQLNVDDILVKLRGLHLPNAKLVRNIYAVGPEGDFERTKLYLERKLESESRRRKSLAGIQVTEFIALPEKNATEIIFSSNAERPRRGLLTFSGARRSPAKRKNQSNRAQ